uniref:PsbP C-terminal domain-containing protein n=1 Tax=Ditylum brightwellii TaxID=49249 RepID=A0A6S8XQR2_9STRA|mmetsp:Transcript_9254/g.13713  ORF Transcript_9254/g.13713 Transcript_9254/m.13713 type:complete len:324 (-) Transcript_9254:412-1383(-)
MVGKKCIMWSNKAIIAVIAAVTASFDHANAFTTLSSSSSLLSFQRMKTPQNPCIVTQMSKSSSSEDDNEVASNRRTFLLQSTLLTTAFLSNAFPSVALADEENLADKLYNPDGSLRNADDAEAKFNVISNAFPGTSTADVTISFDGVSPVFASSEDNSNGVKISYSTPQKWITNTENQRYIDTSEGVNAQACNRIIAYQATGSTTAKSLTKAATNGVAKTLGMTDGALGYNPNVLKADLISGRKLVKNEEEYYEFDLAVAPTNCDSKGKDNLGLGFCPYDSILLASATVKDGKMYVFTVECTKDQWKRSNSDLKLVRSSFLVE